MRQSYDNTADFLLDLYKEENLQQKLEIVVLDLQVLHEEFLACLSANKKGPEEMLKWQARHAFGGYMESCNLMIQNMLRTDELRLDRVRGLEMDDPVSKRDGALALLHWTFTLELISFRAWSQVHLTILPPFHYAMAFLESDDKEEAIGMFKRMANVVMDLEAFVMQNPGNKLVRSLLTDLSTHHWVLTREFIMLGTQKGWDSPEFMEQCVAVFAAGNSTKYTLESAFNHIKDSLRQAQILSGLIP